MILVFQIIFFVCILGILFIIFKKIPKLLDYPRHSFEGVSFLKVTKEKLNLVKEKKDVFWHDNFIPRLEKTLRKIKIILLKLDNFLAKRADKLRDKIKKRENGEENED
ncbi:hypothetical protein KKA23_02685 [Patescibacteria group bacterium]|nr:hypothetical protein [Patescibacteria group bacterium]